MRLIGVVTLLFALSHVAAAQPTIVDSGIDVSPGPGVIHWMSPTRVAFKGLVKGPEGEPAQFPGSRIGKLAILDLASGNVIWDQPFHGLFCLTDSQLVLLADNKERRDRTVPDRFWILRGTPGNLEKEEVSRAYVSGFDFRLNCKHRSEFPPLPSWTEGDQRFRWLRTEHGFLEMTGGGFEPWFPVRFFPSGGTQEQGVPLSHFSGMEMDWPPLFYERRNAYLLTMRLKRERFGTPGIQLWWLRLDGAISPDLRVADPTSPTDSSLFELPSGSKARLNGAVTAVRPIREGWLVAMRGSDRRGRLMDSGLYLLDVDGRSRLLKAGRVSEIVVSPDQCRAAVGLDDQDPIRFDYYRLHVVHVCREGSK